MNNPFTRITLALMLLSGLLLAALCLPARAQAGHGAPLHFVPAPSVPTSAATGGVPSIGLLGGILSGTLGGIPGIAGPSGPQEIQGPKGDTGPKGDKGDPGISATGIVGITAKTFTSQTITTPAYGDGIHDDTAAIQAGIDAAAAAGVPFYLEPGAYNLSAPLLLCRNGSTQYTGPLIRGLAHWSAQGQATDSGVSLHMTAANQEAIFLVGTGQGRGLTIEGISLFGNATLGAGIKTRGTNWSQMLLRNVNISDCGIGIYKSNPDGGGNGEYITAYNVSIGGYVNLVKLYKNDTSSGQGVCDRFFGWQGGTQNGGIAFDIGPGSGSAATLELYGGSLTQTPGPLPNTFIKSRGAAMVKVVGGRYEHTGLIMDSLGGSSGDVCRASFDSCYFTGIGAGPGFQGGGNSSQNVTTLTNCHLDWNANGYASGGAPGSPPAYALNLGVGNLDTIRLENCDFAGWSDYSALQNSTHVTLRDVRAHDGTTAIFSTLAHN